MNTGLTERGVLQAAFNFWDDLTKHGYEYRYESEYYEEASYKGNCILCVYCDFECDNCVLVEGPGGEYSNCSTYPNHPYYLWVQATISRERSLHARAIAALIEKRLDEIIAIEEGSHA